MSSQFLEVTSPAQHLHRRGFHLHCSSLPVDETTIRRGVPVTTVPRTLLDLASVLPANQLERAFHEAQEHLLTDSLSLPDLIARYPGRAGAPAIKRLLDSTAPHTKSELEDLFLAFVARYELPTPRVNALLRVGDEAYECDCLWREQCLIVELDGRAWHDTSLAFERDRARDRRLAAAGWRVIRVTWHQLQQDASPLAADLRAILARS
jgi:very-short-patch-repair endonuclease